MFKKVLKKQPVRVQMSSSEVSPAVTITYPSKKRPRGIPSAPSPPQERMDDLQLVRKVFVKGSERLEEQQNRHMEAYVQQRLSQLQTDSALAEICSKFPEPSKPLSEDEPDSSEDALFKVPKKFSFDDSMYTKAAEKTNWLSGLAEVPLSIEHKLDNIEATETSKRMVLKAGAKPETRFEDIHYEEVEAFHSRRNKDKVDEDLYRRLEKEFKLTRRDRKTSETQRHLANRIQEEKRQKEASS